MKLNPLLPDRNVYRWIDGIAFVIVFLVSIPWLCVSIVGLAGPDARGNTIIALIVLCPSMCFLTASIFLRPTTIKAISASLLLVFAGVLTFGDWDVEQEFAHCLGRVKQGMTREEVDRIFINFGPGEEGSEPGLTLTYKYDDHQGTLDMAEVYFRNGSVSDTHYMRD